MRAPDLIIGPRTRPQTYRWHLVHWRGWQLALHKWWRSDEDRALHDHRADNISIILSPQGYDEVVREWYDPGSHHLPIGGGWVRFSDEWQYHGNGGFFRDVTVRRRAWVPYFRKAEAPHRVVLRTSKPVWSLWLRWPSRRDWGFHCPKGWRTWEEFCNTRDYSAPGSTSEVGKGCE